MMSTDSSVTAPSSLSSRSTRRRSTTSSSRRTSWRRTRQSAAGQCLPSRTTMYSSGAASALSSWTPRLRGAGLRVPRPDVASPTYGRTSWGTCSLSASTSGQPNNSRTVPVRHGLEATRHRVAGLLTGPRDALRPTRRGSRRSSTASPRRRTRLSDTLKATASSYLDAVRGRGSSTGGTTWSSTPACGSTAPARTYAEPLTT